MSDAARHALYAIPELTYGVTPATPAFDRVRHTGTTLAVTKESFQSDELRPDRQIADFRHGNKQTGGEVNFEFSYGSFDKFLEACLGGTWTDQSLGLSSNSVQVLSGDNSFNTTNFGVFLPIVGSWIVTSGFSQIANNGLFRVVSATITKIVVAAALTAEAAGASANLGTTAYLKAGVIRRSFSFMRHFSDQTGSDKPFHIFTGQEINSFSLTVSPGGIVTGTFGAIGKAGTLSGTGITGQTLGNPTTTKVFDSFRGWIKEGNVLIGIATEITQALDNGITPRFVIGSDTTILPSIGRSNMSGQLSVYFENSAMLEKFLNETESSLVYELKDQAGNGYLFTFPKIIYSGGQPDVGGEGPITLAMPFQAIYDSTSATNVSIVRFIAP